MIFGYARVSTADQELALQLDALTAAGCEEVIEEVMSAAAYRPARELLLSKLRRGDTLVVWRLDRFGRSVRDLIDQVELLRERGIEFRSLTENIDTSTAAGRLVFHVFAALAEFERNLISERTKAGLTAARARGRKGGRKSVMNAKKLAMAKKLMEVDGVTVQAAADAIGVGRSTLYRALNADPDGQDKPKSNDQ